jgi:hypothetical protein
MRRAARVDGGARDVDSRVVRLVPPCHAAARTHLEVFDGATAKNYYRVAPNKLSKMLLPIRFCCTTRSSGRANLTAMRMRGLALLRSLAGRRVSAARALTVLAVLICAACYLFYVSAGKPSGWPMHTHLYDLLADGFRSGHLHLSVAPSPLLLLQQNPYDPVHQPLWTWDWMWDVTLHDGQLYLYWGPVPALLLALVKSLFGIDQPVGDGQLVLAFLLLRLVAGTWLVCALLRRCFPAVPAWLAPLAVLLFGLATPVSVLASRAAIYEASIAGGQAFAVLGVAVAFAGISRATGRRWLLAGASLCWGLALGCRLSLAFAMMGLVAVTSAVLLHHRLAQRGRWLTAIVAGGPLLVSVALLGLYNYVRFGAFGNFGTAEQLSTMKFTFSFAHFPANIYSYLLRGPELSCRFPFVWIGWEPGAAAFPSGFVLPEHYVVDEPVLGMLRGVPFLLLAIPAAVSVLRPSLRRALWSPARMGGEGTEGLAAWTFFALLALATLPLLPALGLWTAVMRYEMDVAAAVVLLGTMGAAVLLVQSQGAWRWAAGTLVVGLVGFSVLVGFLLGFQGYDNQLTKHNPQLYQSLQTLTVCQPDRQ